MKKNIEFDDLVSGEKFKVVHDKRDDYWYVIDKADGKSMLFSAKGHEVKAAYQDYDLDTMQQAVLFLAARAMDMLNEETG